MFGSPLNNEKGWDEFTLDYVCNIIYRYPTFYGFDYANNGIPVVRIGNILLDGHVDSNLDNYVFIEKSISEKYPLTILEYNDIVMAVRGDGSTAKRIGRVVSQSIVGANISPNLIRFKANGRKANALYVYAFLVSNGGQIRLNKYVTKTAKKTITAKDIKNIQIPVPPLSLQNRFAEIVGLIDNQKKLVKKALDQSQYLFDGLMAKFFGE